MIEIQIAETKNQIIELGGIMNEIGNSMVYHGQAPLLILFGINPNRRDQRPYN